MARKQRQMRNIDIQEVSIVDFPAHGVEGFVIRKSTDEDDLPLGAVELKDHEVALAEPILRGVPNGSMVEFEEAGKGTTLGRTTSGKPFILTTAAAKKAAQQAQWG